MENIQQILQENALLKAQILIKEKELLLKDEQILVKEEELLRKNERILYLERQLFGRRDQVKKLWGVDKNISFAKKTNADKWI